MSETIQASHILISHADTDGAQSNLTREEAEAKIKDLEQQLTDGADFAETATANSDCPSSSKGGDLGSFGQGAMAEPFGTTAFALEVDETSGVVETIFGYHLIRRTG